MHTHISPQHPRAASRRTWLRLLSSTAPPKGIIRIRYSASTLGFCSVE